MKLIIVALISTLAVSVYGQELTCTQLEQNAEIGLRKLMLVEEGAKIPTNLEELEVRCAEAKKLGSMMLKIKKCLENEKNAVAAQVFGNSAKNVKKMIEERCDQKKEDTLKLMKCATPEKVREGTQCVVGSLDIMQEIANSAGTDDKKAVISKMCCLAHVASECARQKLGSVTCPDSSVKPADEFEKVLNALSQGTIDITCGEYQDLMACKAKVPDAVTAMTQKMNSAGTTVGTRSFVKPLKVIATKMGD